MFDGSGELDFNFGSGSGFYGSGSYGSGSGEIPDDPIIEPESTHVPTATPTTTPTTTPTATPLPPARRAEASAVLLWTPIVAGSSMGALLLLTWFYSVYRRRRQSSYAVV